MMTAVAASWKNLPGAPYLRQMGENDMLLYNEPRAHVAGPAVPLGPSTRSRDFPLAPASPPSPLFLPILGR